MNKKLGCFLKVHGAYEAFCRNLDFPEKPRTSLTNGFSWEDSPEGHNYWNRLNREYRRIKDEL